VWLEPVSEASIESLTVVPDVKTGKVSLRINNRRAREMKVGARWEVLDGKKVIASDSTAASVEDTAKGRTSSPSIAAPVVAGVAVPVRSDGFPCSPRARNSTASRATSPCAR